MKTRYVWLAHGLAFKTLKAARAWCSTHHDGVSIISRVKAGGAA
jgi:hypothetical protein